MEDFLLNLSIVLVGTALLSFLAVVFKQPIIIAYIACGVLVGPWGAGWIKHVEFIEILSHIGITLLLFLAGLCLHPQKLIRLFKETALATFASCFISFIIAFFCARIFNFTILDSICIGLALMFSSTILAIKLMPTTRLHHQKMGAICIGVLIMQDLLAIIVLSFLRSFNSLQGAINNFIPLIAKIFLFIGALFLFEQFILRKIMLCVERLHELLFLFGLAWCFGAAGVSNSMGLFYETGAFFAGVVLARHPIALFISERLKPLRDFFLVLFFFALGAKLNLLIMRGIFLQALVITLIFILVKPWIFKKFFMLAGEQAPFAQEIGIRLGQFSEFSLLIAIMAFSLGHISINASQLIQLVTILTFIASSYLVISKYPTPIGTSEQLIKD